MDSENKEQLLKLLYDEALRDESKRKKKAKEVNITKKRLQEAAELVLTNYTQHCEEIRPVAEEKLNTIIHPWWQTINEPEITTQIQTVLQNKKISAFAVSTSIWHQWPYEVLTSEGFTYTARFINEYKKSQQREEKLAERIDRFSHEKWQAVFSAWFHDGESGLTIARYPASGGGCGFRAEKYAIPVDFEGNFIAKVNPIVVTKFADQIESGQVWSQIEQSLTGRKS